MAHSTELRQQIDDLALQLVVAEPGSGADARGWMNALQRIREQAVGEQAVELAAATVALVESMSVAADDGSVPPADVLQKGIVHLQQIAEGEVGAPATPPPPSSLAQDPELLGDFVMESREHLVSIESQLLTLESDPSASEALNSVFRGFHTIKGLAGFLELWDVQKLAHETETVLDRARSSQWTLPPDAFDVILESADYLRRWLTHLESALQGQQSEAPPANEALIGRIRALTADSSPNPEPAAELAHLAAAVEAPPAEAPVAAAETARPRNEAMAVRVDTAKLDYLVDMAGEMVIAESLVRHDPELLSVKSQTLQRKLAQMTRITAELQKTAMAMRLVPIGPLFRRMSRLVRDLSRQFGKPVRMETEGDEIELDRTIVEELADPLMHMVRNAMDHGIEMPNDRTACGKSAGGCVLLKAQHQSGQVVIEISDDGRGLDPAKIKAKAIEKGLLAPERELSESEIFNLIFEPGFTTAAQITNVSGRGVGMDVVRRHIEKLRGRIEVRSTLGHGSAFLLKLPLTLAIIDGLVVGVGSQRYIVPLFAVREMFRPTAETVWTVQQRNEMALVRGNLLPVLRLHRRFNVTPRSTDPTECVLVVAEVEGACYCLLVDELIGKQEVVIKSLGETFSGVTGIAGGAIMGDGRVGLILDVDRLLQDGERETRH